MKIALFNISIAVLSIVLTSCGGGGSSGSVSSTPPSSPPPPSPPPSNSAPMITSDNTVSVLEMVKVVYDASANDPDGDTLTWSLMGTESDDRFTVDPDTGVVRFKTISDHESLGFGQSDYSFTIKVDDGELNDTLKVVVDLQDYPDDRGYGFIVKTSSDPNFVGAPSDILSLPDLSGDGRDELYVYGPDTHDSRGEQSSRFVYVFDEDDHQAGETKPFQRANQFFLTNLTGFGVLQGKGNVDGRDSDDILLSGELFHLEQSSISAPGSDAAIAGNPAWRQTFPNGTFIRLESSGRDALVEFPVDRTSIRVIYNASLNREFDPDPVASVMVGDVTELAGLQEEDFALGEGDFQVVQDMDGDGFEELAYFQRALKTSPNRFRDGIIRIIMSRAINANRGSSLDISAPSPGKVIHILPGPFQDRYRDHFAEFVSGVPDFDGDGREDFIFNHTLLGSGQLGIVLTSDFILTDEDGLITVSELEESEYIKVIFGQGASIAPDRTFAFATDDLDDDGRRDLVISDFQIHVEGLRLSSGEYSSFVLYGQDLVIGSEVSVLDDDPEKGLLLWKCPVMGVAELDGSGLEEIHCRSGGNNPTHRYIFGDEIESLRQSGAGIIDTEDLLPLR